MGKELKEPRGHPKGTPFTWGSYLHQKSTLAVPAVLFTHPDNARFAARAQAVNDEGGDGGGGALGTIASPRHEHNLRIVLPADSAEGTCAVCSNALKGKLAGDALRVWHLSALVPFPSWVVLCARTPTLSHDGMASLR
jgi:hypothetical protein